MRAPLAALALAAVLAGTAGAHDADNVFIYVQKGGQGYGRIVSEPYGIDCGATCVSQFAASWEANYMPVTLTATADPGSTFVRWEGACSGSAPVCTVELPQAQLVVATFDGPPRRRHQVSVSFTGSGAVASVEQPGISCGQTCTTLVDDGQRLTLRALPETGWYFDGWSGGCSGTISPCALTVAGPTLVQAVFREFGDAVPPTTTALASSARRGETARLRYRASDDRGRTRETIVVYRGVRRLATVRGPLGDRRDAGVLFYFLPWRVPASLALGTLRFCVQSEDATGNRSLQSCASLTVR